jgi:hypothetical protein
VTKEVSVEEINASLNSATAAPDFVDMGDFVRDAEVHEPATLERLTALAAKAKSLEAEISKDTVELEEKQSALNKIMRDQIPTIMEELALDELKMSDGSKLSVSEEIRCGISEERKGRAFKWLEDNNFDGIIKTKVVAEFGKGDMENARLAKATLERDGFSPSLDRSVHPATLKSFVKEQLEKGNASLPMDVFGVFPFKQAKIRLPGKRK